MAAPTFAPALVAGIASSRRRGPTSPDSGYGSRIGAPPGAMFRADFVDRDRDGVDDRTQPGPGMARPSQGANFGGVRRGPSSGRSGKPPQSSLDKMARRKERVTGRLQEGLDRSEARAAQAITRRKTQD
jgi:hypothetical protein